MRIEFAPRKVVADYGRWEIDIRADSTKALPLGQVNRIVWSITRCSIVTCEAFTEASKGKGLRFGGVWVNIPATSHGISNNHSKSLYNMLRTASHSNSGILPS